MKGLNPLGLAEQDKGGAFFLYGEDEFRKESTGRALVAWHLDPATRDFNYDLLRGTEVDVQSLASILATPPMMAEWRVVFLREVEGLASSPKARDTLLEAVKSPPPGLALVMMATLPRDSKAKFYREIIRHARSMEFTEIRANDVPGWLTDWSRSHHGVEMTEEAARALAGAVGTDLGVLAQEVEKLASVVPEDSSITVETVRAAGTHIPTQDRWEWMDLVGNRDFSGALEGLSVLLARGESGVSLVIGLSTHLLRLGLVRSGGSEALEANLPPRQRWLSTRLARQARGWSLPELSEALKGLKRADRILKSSSGQDDRVLEAWIMGLMVRREGGG